MNWLTEQLPGTGGHYKTTPEDFQVDEIPLYAPCGSGEHLYLWIEKAGISTRGVIDQLQKELKIKEWDIGYAGLKDANALTRQMISIPLASAGDIAALQLYKARIVRSQQHTNKLRLGHLAGNRFKITLRDVHPQAATRAAEILHIMQQSGVPNLFGEQRYGVLGNSGKLGLLLLQGDYQTFCSELMGDPEKIRNEDWKAAAAAYRAGNWQEALAALPRRMRDEQRMVKALVNQKTFKQAAFSLPKSLLRLFLSATQSSIFDQFVLNRLTDLGKLETGDIAFKHVNGACFRVTDGKIEQPRGDSFEISPTAPLFGTKVMLAEGEPGKLEQRHLQESGITLQNWQLDRGLSMPGERRPLRVPLFDQSISTPEDCALTLEFSLPKGSYATSVLREVIKATNE